MATDLCSAVGGNPGGPNCDTKRGRPKKPVVGSKAFSSSEYADADTLQAAIVAACKLDNGNTSKLYPFPEVKEVSITTPASSSGNLAFGSVKRLVKGIPSYEYLVEVGWAEYQKLLAFDNKIVPVFTLDDAGNFWGYRAAAAQFTPNTKNYTGELARINVEGSGFENGTEATAGVAKITVSYISVDDFEKRGTYMNLPNLASGDLVGLKDVLLSEPSAHSTNVYKIKATIPLPKLAGDLNIYDEFGAILAAATWTAFTGTTYTTSLAITSIAVDATLKALTVTFDSTAFTALTGGAKIKLVPPSVATLDAAGATGIEIGYIIVTK
jgi:hypothetical protein